MNLWCSRHKRNHRVTAGQAERIIYALACEVGSALAEPDGDRVHAGSDAFDLIACPTEYLEMSSSGEGYGEMTDSMVYARRQAEREDGNR